ncbi:flagellar export chaperone FliS [Mobilicoccus caccae]|uniref:Flagellar protein FliS n=1 Tax=Mobilicoccus caccae TaxID=1859295 RepID=A0ABQ6IT03_9MICO|nr:flagellar export chaperone FliS [Mobilicoccus caccae]GMA41064.1 flagellar protein FliS [Mobilicoccus caccae]
MTTQSHLRNRYAREAVTTASPAKLVTMLYDRLLKDLHDAEAGLGARDIQSTHNALSHAQDILWEFHSTLDTSVWKEGENLKRIYEWAIDMLMNANMEKNLQRVVDVREVLEPLAEAWHQVAAQGVNGER